MPSGVDEKDWEKAKELAAKQGKSKNYAYVMGIYNKLHEKTYYTNLSHYELNERPENLLAVTEVFKWGFAYPMELESLTTGIFEGICKSNSDMYKNYFQNLETSKIRVDQIVPTQMYLLKDKLLNWEERSLTTYPEFIKIGDFYYLLDGHHRVANWIEQGYSVVDGKVLDSDNPLSSREVKPYKSIYEDIKIPLDIGDEIKTGKFKNKKAIVKGFGKDDKGQPTVKTSKGETPLFKFRISKLMPSSET